MFNFLLESGAQGGSSWITIAMIALVFAVFYFLLIRPEKKRERAAQEMRAALQVGDEVTTIGGIIGKVVSIKEETFVLETTRDRTRIRFLITAIRSVDVKAEDSVSRYRAAGKPEEPAATKAVATPVAEESTEATDNTENA